MAIAAKIATGAGLLTALGSVASLMWASNGPQQPSSTRPELLGAAAPPLLDSDGDLLPDKLEFVTHSDASLADSDGDGRSDFVELIDYSTPLYKDQPRVFGPNGFRVLVHTTEFGPKNQQVLWIHFLFRFQSGLLSDLRGLAVFLDIGGHRYALDDLLVTSFVEFVHKSDPVRGLLTRTTVAIPLPAGFQNLAPLTIGSYAMIHRRVYRAGSMLFYGDGAYHTLVPTSASSAVLQVTSPTPRNPFWASSRTCVLELEIQGAGRSGHICEVKKASCKPSQASRRCMPGCSGMGGTTFIVPDGIGLILGG